MKEVFVAWDQTCRDNSKQRYKNCHVLNKVDGRQDICIGQSANSRDRMPEKINPSSAFTCKNGEGACFINDPKF